MDNSECYNKTECIETREKPNKDVLFCCCEGSMCNSNFSWIPTPSPTPNISGLYNFSNS